MPVASSCIHLHCKPQRSHCQVNVADACIDWVAELTQVHDDQVFYMAVIFHSLEQAVIDGCPDQDQVININASSGIKYRRSGRYDTAPRITDQVELAARGGSLLNAEVSQRKIARARRAKFIANYVPFARLLLAILARVSVNNQPKGSDLAFQFALACIYQMQGDRIIFILVIKYNCRSITKRVYKGI